MTLWVGPLDASAALKVIGLLRVGAGGHLQEA